MFKIFTKLKPSAINNTMEVMLMQNKKVDTNIYFTLESGDYLSYIGISLQGDKAGLWEKIFSSSNPVFCVIETYKGYDVFYKFEEQTAESIDTYRLVRKRIYENFVEKSSGRKITKFKIPGSNDWDSPEDFEVSVVYHEPMNSIDWDTILGEDLGVGEYAGDIYADTVNLRYINKLGEPLTNFLFVIIGSVVLNGRYTILYKIKTSAYTSAIIEYQDGYIGRQVKTKGPFTIYKDGSKLVTILLEEANNKKLECINNIGFHEGKFFGGSWMMSKTGLIRKEKQGIIGKYYLRYMFNEDGIYMPNFKGLEIPDKTKTDADLADGFKLLATYNQATLVFINIVVFLVSSLYRKWGYSIPTVICNGPPETGKTTSINLSKMLLGVEVPSMSASGLTTKGLGDMLSRGLPVILGEYANGHSYITRYINALFDGHSTYQGDANGGIILDTNTRKFPVHLYSRCVRIKYSKKGRKIDEDIDSNLLFPILMKFLNLSEEDFSKIIGKSNTSNRIESNFSLIRATNTVLGNGSYSGEISRMQKLQIADSRGYKNLMDNIITYDGEGTD